MNYVVIEDIGIWGSNCNYKTAIYKIEEGANVYTGSEGFYINRVLPKKGNYRFEWVEDIWYTKSHLLKLCELKSMSHPYRPKQFTFRHLTENEYLMETMK